MVTAAGGTANTKSRPVTNGAYYAASVLYRAGFRSWPLTVMTAIAGVESNWAPYKINNDPATGDYSVGLTQVNYYGNLLSSRTQQYGAPSSLVADPAAQGAATFSLAGGNSLGGLSNWGGGQWNGQNGTLPSFTEPGYASAFAKSLPQAAAAVGQVGTFGPAPVSATSQAANWPGTSGGAAVTTGGFTSPAALSAAVTPPVSGCGAIINKDNPAQPHQLFTIPHTSLGPTYCQLKAIKGATLLGIGSAVCIFGVALVVIAGLGSKTPAGRAITSVVGSRGSSKASSLAASDASPANLAGSPARRGSASSHAPPRSVGRDPDDSFTDNDATIEQSYAEQQRAA